MRKLISARGQLHGALMKSSQGKSENEFTFTGRCLTHETCNEIVYDTIKTYHRLSVLIRYACCMKEDVATI